MPTQCSVTELNIKLRRHNGSPEYFRVRVCALLITKTKTRTKTNLFVVVSKKLKPEL